MLSAVAEIYASDQALARFDAIGPLERRRSPELLEHIDRGQLARIGRLFDEMTSPCGRLVSLPELLEERCQIHFHLKPVEAVVVAGRGSALRGRMEMVADPGTLERFVRALLSRKQPLDEERWAAE